MKINRNVPPSSRKWLWPTLGWTVAVGVIAGSIAVVTKGPSTDAPLEVPASTFMKRMAEGAVASVEFNGDLVEGTLKDGTKVKSVLVKNSDMATKVANGVPEVRVIPEAKEKKGSNWATFLAYGIVILTGFGIYSILTQSRRGGEHGPTPGGMGAFISNRARRVSPSNVTTRFADVAGCDEAKAELEEVVTFLKDGEKFKRLGGKIPRGVLLVGPPGTGKTLLASAVAGEAKVPFFSISGSEFVEMFVGVGAARVRDVFSQAKKLGTAIIFIDEIDAIGKTRSNNGTGSDEQEQTLNQLLVEMNGIDGSSNVIVLAATNRGDILDEALTRPGRFDRQVMVDLPDVHGREAILKVHTASVPLESDVSLTTLAKGTPGFSGAELSNLVNEAALAAGRVDAVRVNASHFDKALDKVIMGLERKTSRMDKNELLTTSYHEAGHAVLAALLPGCDPVHKVSIVPRGNALGVTVQLPERDRYSLSKTRILSEIKVLFGGRIAEELFTGDITTGASNDYERANSMARNFVARWGMSEKIGPVMTVAPQDIRIGQMHPQVFSENLRQQVDEEVKRILDECYESAQNILLANKDIMHSMAAALMAHETIDAAMVKSLMDRQTKFDKYEL